MTREKTCIIEPIEPEWASNEIAEYVAYLNRKIAETMIIPPYLFHDRAYLTTEPMRQELNYLAENFLTTPAALIRVEE